MDALRAVARRLVVGLPREGLAPDWERDFAAFPPAGVILFRRDFRDLADLRRLTARLRSLAQPGRLLIGMDEEGGLVSQLAGHLVVPPNATLLARGAEPGDIEWAARVTGGRLRALGVDWVYAPVADVNAESLNPVIGPRAYGTDAESAARGVAEAVRGFQAARMACCLKHFPGHGSTTLDSHLALPRCDADRATLEARDLAPFRAGRDAGAGAVMTAHVVYPALDAERPATFSRAAVTDLLRGTLAFEGVCITDALEMKGAAEGRGPAEAARRALAAGADLLLFAFHDEALPGVREELARGLENGAFDAADWKASERRLAAFTAAYPEPAAQESARPIAAFTPPGFEARLERIIERGLVVRGLLPAEAAAGPWSIEEPEFAHGPTFAAALVAEVGRVTADAGEAALAVVIVASRVPLPALEIDRLRGLCRERPTAVVGLQNDHFLDALPEAALRISTSDSTPLTRAVVARRLAGMRQGA